MNDCKVVASLTTIPSRIGTSCKDAIDSLIHQVDHIYLGVSTFYNRLKSGIEIPEIYNEAPYKDKLTIVFGEDMGPATKYLGCLSIIPEDCWMFVCDDDQVYHPTLIERMKCAIKYDSVVYQNRYETFSRWGTSGGLIHGYVGNLIPRKLLNNLPTFPYPECAHTIDDQWLSVYFLFNNIEIHSTGIDDYTSIFAKLNPSGYEQIGTDSLSNLGTRELRIQELEQYFNIRFKKYTIHIERLG